MCGQSPRGRQSWRIGIGLDGQAQRRPRSSRLDHTVLFVACAQPTHRALTERSDARYYARRNRRDADRVWSCRDGWSVMVHVNGVNVVKHNSVRPCLCSCT